jgi:hypothetical protein
MKNWLPPVSLPERAIEETKNTKKEDKGPSRSSFLRG